MFFTEITDSFVVYNHTKKCCEKKHLSPANDILWHGEKTKKVSSRKQWYPDCNLQMNGISLCCTTQGKYLRFDLCDYGVRDIRLVFYRLLLAGKPLDDKEYCQSIWYDANDAFPLFAPISEDDSVEDIVLCITGIKYLAKNESVEIFSPPQKITAAEKKTIQNIRSAREEHIALPESAANSTKISSMCKFSFTDDYLPTAWQLYPELTEALAYANERCDLLEQAIAALPQTISEINTVPPSLDDTKVYVPIECTFNPRFYARLFMLKEHNVEGQVISGVDMLQLQIPIKADNEPLLLFLYGTHWLDPLLMPSDQVIGEDKCADILTEAKEHSVILGFVDEIRNRTSNKYCERMVLSSNVFKKYLRCVESLRAWIKARYAEVSAYSKAERPSTWTNEYKLFRYVKMLIPDAVYQYRADWLEFQSLDVFLPSYNCAIEYQGRQHYDPLEYFGGDAGLMERQKNDADKVQKCEAHGVKLLEWSYTEKVFFSKVCAFLNEGVQPGLVDDAYIRKCLISSVPFPVTDLFAPATYAQTKATESSKAVAPLEEIRKYGMDGQYICSYATIVEAAADVQISGQQISKALSGRATTAGGFLWKRTAVDAPIDSVQMFQPKDPENASKSIYQISVMGEIVGEFDSINAAEKATGINRKSIRDVLNGRQKRAGGFFWRSKSDT